MNIVPSFQLASIAAAISLALGAAGGWKVTSWYYGSKVLAQANATHVTERASLEQTIEKLRKQAATAAEVSSVYQQRLIDVGNLLHARELRPARDVRVCKSTPVPSTETHRTDQPAGRSDGAAPTAGMVLPGVGRGLGEVVEGRILYRAEELAAQVAGLQAYIMGNCSSDQ